MSKNLLSIAFDDESIEEGKLEHIDPSQFVPLADVPDFVWRTKKRNNPPPESRIEDDGNHFADMDQEGKAQFEGETLLDLTKRPENVDIETWNRFYESLGNNSTRGALPFRVWQIYNEMVKFVNQRDIAKFVCAAGILAHYVADACQPLHATQFYDGRPDHPDEKGIYSYYEDDMVDKFAVDIIAKINRELANSSVTAEVSGGENAAIYVIHLMRKCSELLPILDIFKAYVESKSEPTSLRHQHFFDAVSKSTISCMVEGCLRLASLWESAWIEGNGEKVPGLMH